MPANLGAILGYVFVGEAGLKNHDPGKLLNGLFDLENKVAVVIGGTGVLCGAMAWGLLEAGCRVVEAAQDFELERNCRLRLSGLAVLPDPAQSPGRSGKFLWPGTICADLPDDCHILSKPLGNARRLSIRNYP